MPNNLDAIKRAFEKLLGNPLSIYGIAKNIDWEKSYEELTKTIMKSRSWEASMENLIALSEKEEKTLGDMINSILEDLFNADDLKDLQSIIKKNELIFLVKGKRRQKKSAVKKAKKKVSKKSMAKKATIKATKKAGKKKAAKKKASPMGKKATKKKMATKRK